MGSGGNGDTNSFNTSAGFYKNLFYILIGLLALFGCISIASYIRARRKNQMIWREAERLGVLVPGMTGYYDGRDAVLRMVNRQQTQQRQGGGVGGATTTTVALSGKDGRKPEVWDAVAENEKERTPVFSLTSKDFVSRTQKKPVLCPCGGSPPTPLLQTPLAIAPLFQMPATSNGSSDALNTPYRPPPRSTLEIFPNAVAVPVQLIQRAMALEQQEAAIREAAVEADEVLERWTGTLGGGETPESAPPVAAAAPSLNHQEAQDSTPSARPSSQQQQQQQRHHRFGLGNRRTDSSRPSPTGTAANLSSATDQNASRQRVLEAIAREPAVHVTVLVRMPVEHQGDSGKDEDAAIQEAYEGMCFGTTKLEVVK